MTLNFFLLFISSYYFFSKITNDEKNQKSKRQTFEILISKKQTHEKKITKTQTNEIGISKRVIIKTSARLIPSKNPFRFPI